MKLFLIPALIIVWDRVLACTPEYYRKIIIIILRLRLIAYTHPRESEQPDFSTCDIDYQIHLHVKTNMYFLSDYHNQILIKHVIYHIQPVVCKYIR